MARWREKIAQAEIDNLDVASLANENVLNLQIPMNNRISVAIVERRGDLSPEFACLFFLEAPVIDDVVQHLASVDILEHHVPVVVGLDVVAHAADVRMVDETDDCGLTRSADLLGMICALALCLCAVLVCRYARDDLDGNLQGTRQQRTCGTCCNDADLLSSLNVLRKLHLAHAPGPESLAQGPCPRVGSNRGPPTRLGARGSGH